MENATRWMALALVAITGLLLCGSVYLNTGPILLTVDLATGETDEAQVFYSAANMWNEDESRKLPTSPGVEHLTFEIPASGLGTSVRFDPGRIPGEYHILGVRWQRGLISQELPVETLVNIRPGPQTVSIDHNRLIARSADNDLQLAIPTPGPFWRAAGLLWPLGIAVLAWLGLLVLASNDRIDEIGITKIYVIALSAFYCAVSAVYWTPLPILDDWRYVLSPPFQIIGGGYAWLTAVGNDTYFLTGQLIDFLALSLSNIDFGVLRAVSLLLMFVQMWVMYRLICRHVTPVSRAGTAVAIILIAATLTANGYWGGTAIAYHQFLPLLFTTLALVYIGDSRRASRLWPTVAILAVLCTAAGLAYISGGLMLAAVGMGLLLAHADSEGRRLPAFRASLLLLIFGVALLALQLWLVNKTQGSLLEHNHAVASVLPNDVRFWIFIVALFGRAAGYAGLNIAVDILLLIVAVLPAVFIGIERLWNGVIRGQACERPFLTGLILAATAAALVYAAAIGFGRSGFVAADQPAFIVALVAKSRFHFWTIAALLPLLWLGWVELALRWRYRLDRRIATTGLALAALILVMPKSLAPFKLAEFFREADRRATQGAYCLITQMNDNPTGEPIVCQGILGMPTDLTGTLQRLKSEDRKIYRQLERIAKQPRADTGN